MPVQYYTQYRRIQQLWIYARHRCQHNKYAKHHHHAHGANMAMETAMHMQVPSERQQPAALSSHSSTGSGIKHMADWVKGSSDSSTACPHSTTYSWHLKQCALALPVSLSVHEDILHLLAETQWTHNCNTQMYICLLSPTTYTTSCYCRVDCVGPACFCPADWPPGTCLWHRYVNVAPGFRSILDHLNCSSADVLLLQGRLRRPRLLLPSRYHHLPLEQLTKSALRV